MRAVHGRGRGRMASHRVRWTGRSRMASHCLCRTGRPGVRSALLLLLLLLLLSSSRRWLRDPGDDLFLQGRRSRRLVAVAVTAHTGCRRRLHARVGRELLLLRPVSIRSAALRIAPIVSVAKLLVPLKGFPEDALLLLRRRRGACRQWSRVPADWRRLKVLVQNLDKVRGKEPDHAAVSSQSAHPPRAVARIQTFNQVALDEAEILLALCVAQVSQSVPLLKTPRRASIAPTVPLRPMSRPPCTSKGTW